MAKLKNVLLLFGLFLSFAAGILPAIESDIKSLSGGVGVIDLEYYYTPARVFYMLQSYGPEGIHLYIIAQWSADLIFPLVGGFFLANLLVFSGAERFYVLGVAVTLIDWIENVFISILLLKYPVFDEQTAWLSCICTSSKWILFFSSILISILFLIKRLAVKQVQLKV
ncbi:MAG: hypothetical protein JNJ57_20270 [Saprospiraceae bacterium]|nr:hypothetical protein [Saprospiraceae bacterium]